MFVSSVARRHIARICTNPIYSIKVSKCALFLNIENASEKSVPFAETVVPSRLYTNADPEKNELLDSKQRQTTCREWYTRHIDICGNWNPSD